MCESFVNKRNKNVIDQGSVKRCVKYTFPYGFQFISEFDLV